MAISPFINLAANTATAATSATTASISPAANKLYLATVTSNFSTSADPNQPTLTGNSLTWVAVATVVWDTSDPTRKRITLFRALGAAPTSGTVAIDFAGQTQSVINWSIEEVAGIDTSGTNGSGAIVQSLAAKDETGTLATQTITLAAFGSVANATFGAFTDNSPNSYSAVGSGFTLLSHFIPSDCEIVTEYTLSNDTTVDITWTAAGGLHGGIAVEIAAAPPIAAAILSSINPGKGPGKRPFPQFVQGQIPPPPPTANAYPPIASLSHPGAGPGRRPFPQFRQGIAAAFGSVDASSATTDGADVLAANLDVVVAASSATTDGADALASNISVINAASSATTDGADTLAASVSVIAAVSSATTDGPDTLAAAVAPIVAASSAATEGADVLAAAVDNPPASVDLSAPLLEGADALNAAAQIVSTDTFSGGYFPDLGTLRERKRREPERIELAELPQAVIEALPQTLKRRKRVTLEQLIGAVQAADIPLIDIEVIFQAAERRKRQQQDDELLLFY